MAEGTTTTSSIPSVMKAAQQNSYGDVRNVLTLGDDVAVPRQLSSKQILVRVNAASINPVDWKLLNGNLSLVSRYTFPHIPGNDVAGVVVDIGSDVKRFKVGDKVYGNVGLPGGSYAEYVRGNESNFALKPNNLTMEEAAAVPLACETSYQALFNKVSPPVGAGTKLFICGGSTATGLYAIQLAKAVGAQVATTCSERNFNLLQKLGYKIIQTKEEINNDQQQILVIDYNAKDFGQELKGQNYDAVYDCVGGEQQWISAQQILKKGGQFVTIVGDDTKSALSLKSVATTGASIINRKFWSVFSSDHHDYIIHFLNQTPEDLDNIRKNYIETDKVKPLIDTVYDLQKDGVEALYSLYEKSKSGKAQGKLILKVSDAE
jgi:alcohol dehydrogenase